MESRVQLYVPVKTGCSKLVGPTLVGLWLRQWAYDWGSELMTEALPAVEYESGVHEKVITCLPFWIVNCGLSSIQLDERGWARFSVVGVMGTNISASRNLEANLNSKIFRQVEKYAPWRVATDTITRVNDNHRTILVEHWHINSVNTIITIISNTKQRQTELLHSHLWLYLVRHWWGVKSPSIVLKISGYKTWNVNRTCSKLYIMLNVTAMASQSYSAFQSGVSCREHLGLWNQIHSCLKQLKINYITAS